MHSKKSVDNRLWYMWASHCWTEQQYWFKAENLKVEHGLGFVNANKGNSTLMNCVKSQNEKEEKNQTADWKTMGWILFYSQA